MLWYRVRPDRHLGKVFSYPLGHRVQSVALGIVHRVLPQRAAAGHACRCEAPGCPAAPSKQGSLKLNEITLLDSGNGSVNCPV